MRKVFIIAVVLAALLICAQISSAQVTFIGRVWAPIAPDMAKDIPANTGIPGNYFSPPDNGIPAGVATFPNVRCFASQDGATAETIAMRTWELAPRGWYWMSGSEGKYTLMFTGPSHGLGPAVFIRPTIYTNNFTKNGETIDRKVVPTFDYGVFADNAWDEKPAHTYYQPFIAKGTSITNVGFRVIHDGVDGFGPGNQNVYVSILEVGTGNPETWKQIGTSMIVLEVDGGGAKTYDWTAAWNSGEVPTVPGKKYAVRL